MPAGGGWQGEVGRGGLGRLGLVQGSNRFPCVIFPLYDCFVSLLRGRRSRDRLRGGIGNLHVGVVPCHRLGSLIINAIRDPPPKNSSEVRVIERMILLSVSCWIMPDRTYRNLPRTPSKEHSKFVKFL